MLLIEATHGLFYPSRPGFNTQHARTSGHRHTGRGAVVSEGGGQDGGQGGGQGGGQTESGGGRVSGRVTSTINTSGDILTQNNVI